LRLYCRHVPLQVSPENLALCTAAVEVGRVAAARLTVRDASLGFSKLTPPQRTALATQADRWSDLATSLLTTWRGLPAGNPARRLGAMVRDDDDLILLALIAAPQLDRTLSRAYASLGGKALDVGLLLDLASPIFEQRLGLAGSLHTRAPLRAAALVELANPGPVQIEDEIRVARSVVAALRGEPITPAPDVLTEEPDLAAEHIPLIEAALTLPRWRPGALSVVNGPARECAAIFTLRAAIDRRAGWRIDSPATLTASLRDAALAGAHLALATTEISRPLLAGLHHTAAMTRAALVVSCDGWVPAGLPADTLQLQTRAFHRENSETISHAVPPGAVRSALEVLGY
jgi:hypothetical protein